ncbi:MAG: hypothetical protein J6K55_04930 [Clostridia bacterium]|nr:hypothetical protein [Clostridia bacterium]
MSEKCQTLSARMCGASMALYLIWLLLPAVQTTGRAMTGAACVALFAVGAVLDWTYFKANFIDLFLRAACAVLLPLGLRVFMNRGGTNFAGFYVQQVMFWFPLIFAGYARRRGDRRLWKPLRWILLLTVAVTVCTTIGWLIQGMLRGGRIYAYSRSLGYAGEGREAYLKELMLRNIGGYDFVYAMVAALPLTCILIQQHKGARRGAFILLAALETVMILLSQYTYAMLYAAAILAVEVLALILRRVSKGKIGLGASLLWSLTPFILMFLLRQPLAALAADVCRSLGMSNVAFSMEQLLLALQGQATSADSRLSYYLIAVEGFLRSPVFGSMFSSEKLLSLHSDVLDLLSGTGVLGALTAAGMIYLMGRGSLSGARHHPQRAQLIVCACAVVVTALLGTVVYSRDIMAVTMIGTMLILEGESL